MIYIHGTVLASRVRIYSGLVVSETSDDLESNGDGADFEQVITEVSLTDGDIIGSTDDTNGLLKSSQHALLINCSVRVEILSHEATGMLNVLESMRGETTLASMIIEGAGTID